MLHLVLNVNYHYSSRADFSQHYPYEHHRHSMPYTDALAGTLGKGSLRNLKYVNSKLDGGPCCSEHGTPATAVEAVLFALA
jgi:hypothetical protein